jgi:hypothetical protein
MPMSTVVWMSKSDKLHAEGRARGNAREDKNVDGLNEAMGRAIAAFEKKRAKDWNVGELRLVSGKRAVAFAQAVHARYWIGVRARKQVKHFEEHNETCN